MLHIYVDGSAKNNGKQNSQGGYGIVIFDENQNLIDAVTAHYKNVTNNQMWLQSFLTTFEILNNKYRNINSTIYSDSTYCINIFTSWIYKWSQNNWTNSKKEVIKNLDLIKSIYKYYNIDFFISQINFVKVNGHSNIIGNELADALSTADLSKFSNIILKNHINIVI